MREPRFQHVGVLAAGGEPDSGHGADGERHVGLSTGHEPQLGGMVDDHIHCHGRKIHQHDLCHGPQADNGSADRRSDDGLLGNRRRTDAGYAKAC
jgi:hypothetical protein